MKKLNNNESGFSAVEAILFILVIGIISFVGWYLYMVKHNANVSFNKSTNALTGANSLDKPNGTNTKPIQTSDANSYNGWKTYSLKNDKLTFKYPSDWILKDSTSSDNGDEVIMTDNNGFSVEINNTDTGHPSLDYKPKILGYDAVIFLGQSANIDYASGSNVDNLVHQSYLSKSISDVFDTFPTKNLPSAGNMQLISFYVDKSGQIIGKSLSDTKSDINNKNVQLVVKSMSY